MMRASPCRWDQKTAADKTVTLVFNEEATREQRLMLKDDDGNEVSDEDGHRMISEALLEAFIEIREIPNRKALPIKLAKYNDKRRNALPKKERETYEDLEMPAPPEVADEVRIGCIYGAGYGACNGAYLYIHVPACISLCTLVQACVRL